MSRTWKDRKYRWWDDPRPYWRRPLFCGSSMVRRCCRFFWKSERRRVKQQLAKGEEPWPTKTRSSVRWDAS